MHLQCALCGREAPSEGPEAEWWSQRHGGAWICRGCQLRWERGDAHAAWDEAMAQTRAREEPRKNFCDQPHPEGLPLRCAWPSTYASSDPWPSPREDGIPPHKLHAYRRLWVLDEGFLAGSDLFSLWSLLRSVFREEWAREERLRLEVVVRYEAEYTRVMRWAWPRSLWGGPMLEWLALGGVVDWGDPRCIRLRSGVTKQFYCGNLARELRPLGPVPFERFLRDPKKA